MREREIDRGINKTMKIYKEGEKFRNLMWIDRRAYTACVLKEIQKEN